MTQEEREQLELKQFILSYWQKRTTVHWAVVAALFTALGFIISQKLDHPNFDHFFCMASIFLLLGYFLLYWMKEFIKINVLLEYNKLNVQHITLLKTDKILEHITDLVAIGCVGIGIAFYVVNEFKEVIEKEKLYAISLMVLLIFIIILFFFTIMLSIPQMYKKHVKKEVERLGANTCNTPQNYQIEVYNSQDGVVYDYTVKVIPDKK